VDEMEAQRARARAFENPSTKGPVTENG